MCYKHQKTHVGHLWLPRSSGSKPDGLTPLLTFLTVRPVEPIRTLTDPPVITEASVPTPSRTLGCTKEKKGIMHVPEARPGETLVVISTQVLSVQLIEYPQSLTFPPHPSIFTQFSLQS